MRRSARRLATVRTDRRCPNTRYYGDDHRPADPAVEVRPLTEITGETLFNEVFLNDVFVSDDDVVGE